MKKNRFRLAAALLVCVCLFVGIFSASSFADGKSDAEVQWSPKFKEQALINSGKFKLTAAGFGFDEERGYILRLDADNNSGKSVTVGVNSMVIDSCRIALGSYTYFLSETVKNGDSVSLFVYLPEPLPAAAGAESFDEITLSIDVSKSGVSKPLFSGECEVELPATKTNAACLTGGIGVICDDATWNVQFKGVSSIPDGWKSDPNGSDGERDYFFLLLENKTDARQDAYIDCFGLYNWVNMACSDFSFIVEPHETRLWTVELSAESKQSPLPMLVCGCCLSGGDDSYYTYCDFSFFTDGDGSAAKAPVFSGKAQTLLSSGGMTVEYLGAVRVSDEQMTAVLKSKNTTSEGVVLCFDTYAYVGGAYVRCSTLSDNYEAVGAGEEVYSYLTLYSEDGLPEESGELELTFQVVHSVSASLDDAVDLRD